MREFETYIFDFDGTLVDSIVSLLPVFKHAFKAVGQDCELDECQAYIRNPLSDTMRKRGVPSELEGTFVSAIEEALDFKETIDLVEIYDDTMDLLKHLKDAGKRIGIVSSNSCKHIRMVNEKLGLENFFDAIVGHELYQNSKPDKEPCLMALKMLGIKDFDRVVYVGDSINDVLSGEGAGIKSILIDRENYYPDYSKEKISSLKELIS